MAQEGGGELNWQQQELMNKAAPKAGRCDWGDSEAPCDAPRDNQSAVPLAHISLSLGFQVAAVAAKEAVITAEVVAAVAVVAAHGEQRKKASSCTLEICLGKLRYSPS